MVNIPVTIVSIFVIFNIITALVYGMDKKKAKNNEWRISESTLLSIAVLFPWGSLIGMYAFRHKTRKPKFKLVWLIALFHFVLSVVLIKIIFF